MVELDLAHLDEPSSALDPRAENDLLTRFIELTKNKTVIYISHRLSCARLADEIIFFKDGEIIEKGTHEELMRKRGEYEKLFVLQAKNYINLEEVSS